MAFPWPIDYEFDDFESNSDPKGSHKEAHAEKKFDLEKSRPEINDSNANPPLLVSEHGQQVEDIKNKVIHIADIEGFEATDEDEEILENKPIQLKRLDSTEGHHQEEQHTVIRRNKSKLGIVALTPVDGLPKQENIYVNHAMESIEAKPLNDQSRDQELLSIMENTMKKEENDFNHSFDFEPQHEEAGGANNCPVEEVKAKPLPWVESSIEHQFNPIQPSTEQEEDIVRDTNSRPVQDHSGQIVPKEKMPAKPQLNLPKYEKNMEKSSEIGTNPVQTTKNQLKQEIIEISQTPSSMVIGAKTIHDSEQK